MAIYRVVITLDTSVSAKSEKSLNIKLFRFFDIISEILERNNVVVLSIDSNVQEEEDTEEEDTEDEM
jgi:hypothetical protein